MWRPGPTIQIFLGILSGIVLGLSLKFGTDQPWTDRQLMYLQFPGELFLRTVNCLILPLVMTSIVSSSSSLGKSGSIGRKALCYYITTTTLGIILSVLLSQTIRPGEWGAKEANGTDVSPEMQVNFVTVDTILDLIRNLLPENLVQACLSQYQTVLVKPQLKNVSTVEKMDISVYDMEISHEYRQGTNVLGLVFFGLVFGLTLGTMPDEQKQPLQAFFHSLAAATANVIDWVIKAAPIAVTFLISSKILRSQESGGLEAARLGIFVLTVFAGLLIQAFFVLPIIYFVCSGRRSPYKVLVKIGPALVTAFGTSSSTATVPTTIRCLDKLGVDRQVSRFIVPIGATINMDGIALYETIGALFIMQMRGLDLSLVQTIAISITCTLSCIGAAGMPSGGYAMLIMVLNSLGIPAEDVTLIIAVDTFVDRFRTMVNIVADTLGAGLISVLVKNERKQSDNNKIYEMVDITYRQRDTD
ncbi:excitatory amino acid transporter 3 [Nasonia vitripennis]|uniref:Amino acid transporter n=1 Tax=Nasonia vitripennis TaxID=7425 RepID=A0A7M7R2N7_NASVI|nr:excitatory amino acid transporter 3 [Nasonia vitripennis]XP_032457536.1 excitatory amino acid transporter 3 [Nasonia vitripennis]